MATCLFWPNIQNHLKTTHTTLLTPQHQSLGVLCAPLEWLGRALSSTTWVLLQALQLQPSHQACCRRDNNLHMGPAYSAQFRGLESAIKVSPNMTFFCPIKLKDCTRRIKSRISEVLRTTPVPSHKIQLIL